MIAAGSGHTCVARQSGAVACWGANGAGQLGDGTKVDRSEPVTVQGLDDAEWLGLGRSHSCALRKSGAVVCWGDNSRGQLGSGSEHSSARPVAVRGLTDASALASGDDHSCALRATGAVVCWGNNADGQLGNLTRKTWIEPAPIRGLEDAVSIVAGARHTCALRQNGGAICWGANDKGQLGDGTTKGHERPSAVADLTGLVGLAGAGSRTCGFTNQAVYCWGEIEGKSSPRPQKVAEAGSGDAIAELELGPEHACARHTSGVARCWGQNRDGRLGDGSYNSRAYARAVDIGPVTDLALGERHSCALRSDGKVACWGDDASGALGQGEPDGDTPPERSGVQRVLNLDDAVALAAGDGFSCAARKTGEVSCWGRNDKGQLGDASGEPSRPFPGPIAGVDDGVGLSVWLEQACAVRKTGAVVCWGVNDKGQLGRPAGAPLVRPSPIPKLDDATAVSLGAEHGCALRRSGEVYCWGSDAEGQLGDGAGSRGGRVASLSDAVALSSGRAHTCALRRSGSIVCWGANNQGQIGNGAGAAQLKTPVQFPANVSGVSNASEVAVGPEHGCARLSSGNAVCWGRNDAAQLGSGTASSVWTNRVPVRDLSGASALAVGPAHACAASGSRVSCWGANGSGQGGFAGASAPTPRPGVQGLDVASLALGLDHSCARLRSGEVACWGANAHGQLGDGGRMISAKALEVRGL
ncbi:Regulator of chromosome condensation (RCC1) repeat protein [Enhygromyxa salina]|uniref:Regulator of chromosome condensation (RCC1) repeat protein n=2 Tax=Enhygromyxa salina TaxID=215803 RepID=A0A2S9XBJ6_9BACT|nr:Regulator of chromosome condensation (RCC1) repeat protein [Enhygromyxa salina]